MIKRGSYVEIMQIILESNERASNIPEETRNTPLKLWAKGKLLSDCELGKEGSIITSTGRVLKGIVCEANPGYSHGFGELVEEILYIGPQAKSILWGEEVE